MKNLKKGFTLVELLIVLAIGGILATVVGGVAFNSGGVFTDPAATVRTLESMGFTNVQTTGYRLLGCGTGDIRHTGFMATSVNGTRVSGIACSGFFKGTTIRFD